MLGIFLLRQLQGIEDSLSKIGMIQFFTTQERVIDGRSELNNFNKIVKMSRLKGRILTIVGEA